MMALGLIRLTHLISVFKQKLLSGFLWNTLSAFTLQGSNLISPVILTYLLGLENFGAYILVVTTVLMVANIAQGGCGFVATKLVAENIIKNPVRIKSILRLCSLATQSTGLMLSILLFLNADQVSSYILSRPDLEPELQAAALSVLFQASAVYQVGALQGFSAFKDISKINILSGLANIIFLVIGAEFWGVYGALCGFTVATGIRSFICWAFLRSLRIRGMLTGRASIKKEDVRALWRLALPSGLAGLITMPALWLVNLSLSHLSNGLVLVAIFAVIMQIRQAALQLPILLNTVAFSIISREKVLGGDFKKIFSVNILINMIFGIIISVLIIILSGPILSLWHIKSEDGIVALRVMSFSIVPELLAISAYQLVQLHGRMWRSLFQIAIPRDAAYLGIALYFMPSLGLMAATLAYLVSQLIGMMSTCLLVYQSQSRSQ